VCDAATRAFINKAAFLTQVKIGKPPHIQEEQHLFPLVQHFANSFFQAIGKQMGLWTGFLAHIDNFDLGQWTVVDAFCNGQERIFAGVRIVRRF
jgi:hypothetical protein